MTTLRPTTTPLACDLRTEPKHPQSVEVFRAITEITAEV